MSQADFLQNVRGLRRLVALQSLLRWLVRAIWISLGVFLALQAQASLTGFHVPYALWLAASLAILLVVLAGLLPGRIKTHVLVWKIDRIFGLKQQISTAYQEAHKAHIPSLSEELIDESRAKLDAVRARILRKGWFLERDLVSLCIVLLLAFFTYANSRLVPALPAVVPAVPLEALPQVAGEAEKEDVRQPEPEDQESGGQESLTAKDLAALMEAAQKMGQVLSENPQTSPLGEALQALDMTQAAEQLSQLSEEASSLSDEAQQQLAQAMQEGTQSLEGSNLESLSENLQQTQDALEAGDSTGASGALEQLSKNLQTIMAQMVGEQPSSEQGQPGGSQESASIQAGSAGDNREQGQPEDLTRLNGEGDLLELSSSTPDTAELPGALRPSSNAQQPGGQTTQGQGSATNPTIFDPTRAGIFPYQYRWTWKYVVSRYFQPFEK
jgi:hypothetical protein